MLKKKFIRLVALILSVSIFRQILISDISDINVHAAASASNGRFRVYSEENIDKPYDPGDITINRVDDFNYREEDLTKSTLREKIDMLNNDTKSIDIKHEFRENSPNMSVSLDISLEWLFEILNVILLGIPALVVKLYKYFSIDKLYELPGEDFEDLQGKVSGNFQLIELEGVKIKPSLCLRNVEANDRYNMVLNTIRQAQMNYKWWQNAIGLMVTLNVTLPPVMYGEQPAIVPNTDGKQTDVTYELKPTAPMANAYKFELPGIDGTVEFAFTAKKLPPGHIVWLVLPYKGKDNYARVANICIMPDQKFAYVCEG